MTIYKFESLADEIAQAFRNVERTLATTAGCGLHVVHVNFTMLRFSEVNDVMVAISSLHAQPCPNLDRGSCSSWTSNDAY